MWTVKHAVRQSSNIGVGCVDVCISALHGLLQTTMFCSKATTQQIQSKPPACRARLDILCKMGVRLSVLVHLSRAHCTINQLCQTRMGMNLSVRRTETVHWSLRRAQVQNPTAEPQIPPQSGHQQHTTKSERLHRQSAQAPTAPR